MRKKNRESLEAVTHTHTHIQFMEKKTEQWWNPSTRQRVAFYTNRQEENKARVGVNSTLKSIYLKDKESIMLEN